MTMSARRPTLWGNFVYHADQDLLSFAWLYEGGLRVPSYYHAAQAVEKYLKALWLSILDPDGVTETAISQKKRIMSHDLAKLAMLCKNQFPFYAQGEVQTQLRRLSEFDQVARYPWAEQKHGNGFTSDDVPLFCELVRHLRTDIPIKVDDYLLGVLLRRHHQGREAAVTPFAKLARCADALRRVFPNVDAIVRR